MLAGQSEWSDQEIVGVNPTVGRGYLFSGGPHSSAVVSGSATTGSHPSLPCIGSSGDTGSEMASGTFGELLNQGALRSHSGVANSCTFPGALLLLGLSSVEVNSRVKFPLNFFLDFYSVLLSWHFVKQFASVVFICICWCKGFINSLQPLNCV